MIRNQQSSTAQGMAVFILRNASLSHYAIMVVKVDNLNGIGRNDIKPGSKVSIVLKTDQKSGKLTQGIVKDILTPSLSHPHGIKVRLESGQVGRVKELK
jgi:uncharacterized repeat protein (TIGR03833 family)